MKTSPTTYRDYYREQLDKDGIVILEEMIPVVSDSYITTCLMIAFHRQGVMHVRYDLRDMVFSEHKVVTLLPDHMVSDYWMSDDFQRTMIIVSPRIFDLLRHTNSYRSHLFYHQEPESCLTEEQWNSLVKGVDLLRTILQSSSPNRQQMLVNYLDILLELLNGFNLSNRGNAFFDENNRQLFTRFYDLLIEHYRDSRDICYYANALCLTPRYFAKLIKQTTGISASDWIDNYVIMQAKTMLKGYPQYTIQQVGNELGFVEQSCFCRYFKARVGMSPNEFRSNGNV